MSKVLIEDFLCPILRSHQVVIMDNVSFHQVKDVKEAIEKRGACLVYLPPYSPELNPIEQMWGRISAQSIRTHVPAF